MIKLTSNGTILFEVMNVLLSLAKKKEKSMDMTNLSTISKNGKKGYHVPYANGKEIFITI